MKHQLKTVSCLMVVAGSTVAMAQPANDNVNSAMPIGFPLPAMAGTTLGATNQSNIPTLTSCGNSTTVSGVQALINADIQGSRDVWYILTTPGTLVANTSLAASTCGPNTMSDTVVEVYNVAAGGTLGTRITCDDDTCLNRKSRATFTAQPNTQYLIRVATRNNSQGAFELNVLFGTDPRPIDTVQSDGPDVTVGDLSDVYHWGTATLDGVPVRAFSVGTDSWNIGNKPGNWFDYNTTITFRPIGAPAGTLITRPRVSNQHPVIAQQMYRLRNGNFEQIGISWLKHGFTSLNSSSFNQ
ncbi:MAG: hypothetical protein MUE97_05750, partial [Phycisphaerales bacterium]|nr:hypothetical protein [Phycisphaerales bacterium]